MPTAKSRKIDHMRITPLSRHILAGMTRQCVKKAQISIDILYSYGKYSYF